MDVFDPVRLSIMLGLLFLSAFFSGSETALFSLDAVTLARMKKGARLGRLATRIASAPDNLLVSVLFGNMLVNITFYVLSASIVREAARLQGGMRGGLYGVGFLITVIIFGEVLPKAVAVSYPQAVSRIVAVPIYIFMAVVGRWVAVVVRPLIKKEKPAREARATAEELRYLIEISRSERRIDERSGGMVLDIMALSALRARDVMVPRTDVVWVSEQASLEDAAQAASPKGVHRVIVLREDEQDVVGIVDTPAALLAMYEGRGGEPVSSIARRICFFPEVGRASELLEHFHKHPKDYLVAVVDEYGDFSGIVSVEDLAEVFVGEVRDEYEKEEADIEALPDGGYRVPGSLPVHEWLEFMGAEDVVSRMEGETPYSTVAGLVIYHLGRLPKPGDEVEIEGVHFHVTKVDKYRVKEVEVRAGEGEVNHE